MNAIRLILVATFSLLSSSPLAAQSAQTFDAIFTGETMRLDYFHTGGLGREIISLDRIVSDGAWSGSQTRLIDETNLGKYLFQVIDPSTHRTIYSRGFASIYGEWETTEEPKKMHQTFHESLRFPWPKKEVQIILSKRNDQNGFEQIWSTHLDPASRFVNPARLAPRGKVWSLLDNGTPAKKVDLLILGEGYTAKEMDKFHRDAKRLTDKLFATEPFKSRKSDFNVRAIDLPEQSSGVHRPRTKDNRRTAISTQYNVFDSERYVLTYDNRSMRDIASAAPYEFIEILVNEKQYGGGGIYNAQATTSVDSAFSEYVFVHEFGHHFAALADEYYTSQVAYTTGAEIKLEPWEPNVTALLDPARLKWRDLVEPGTPLPTPWNKEIYETRARAIQKQRSDLRSSGAAETEIDKLFRQQQAEETRLFASNQFSGKVGAFEGASYEAKGLYRPEVDCIMFSRNEVGFCKVCRRALERVIDEYSRP